MVRFRHWSSQSGLIGALVLFGLMGEKWVDRSARPVWTYGRIVMNDLFRIRQVITHPYTLLTLAALFWAGNVVLGRDVAGRIPPVTLNSLRWAIALLVLMPIEIGRAHV